MKYLYFALWVVFALFWSVWVFTLSMSQGPYALNFDVGSLLVGPEALLLKGAAKASSRQREPPAVQSEPCSASM